jgi:ribonuclease HI
MRHKIYTDGSGDGRMVWYNENTGECKIYRQAGITNNQAEYLSIIKALESHSDESEIIIFSDSQLVVNQLNHKYFIKDGNLRKLALKVWKLIETKNIKFIHIPRKKNKAGKILG